MISSDTHLEATDPAVAGPARRLTTEQWEAGALALGKLELVLGFRAKEENAGKSWKEITKATGVSGLQVCRWRKKLRVAGIQLSAVIDGSVERSRLIEVLAWRPIPGRAPKFKFSPTEAAAIQAHNLQSNRTATAGSPQEATRHAIKLSQVRPELAAALALREDQGKPLLTTVLARQVAVGETTVQAYRTPRNAWLKHVSSSGSLQITVDEDSGEERMIEPGEWLTIDDGTINLICTVPIQKPGDKCWDAFGLMVGRFQFILTADHSSYFIPGFSYTARPRGSYRAEDLTGTMHITFREHGLPRGMYLEQGISKSHLVHETLRRAGVKIVHVASPHQKVVETIFNKLWTKLSFLPGQVGRSMDDDEETTKLYMSCRAGATDPRKHFLPLDVVVKALAEVIHDHNAGWVNSRYGRWRPAERWETAKAKKILRPLDPQCEWMFSPCISKPLTVKGFEVATTVRLMDGLSQEYHFQADWLQEFHKARVRLHFNAFAEVPATVVLAEAFRGTAADTMLGVAPMTDRHARMNLRKLCYGEFPDIGLIAAKQNSQALVRVAKSIRPDGKPGITTIESRTTASVAPAAPVRARAFKAPTQEEFDRTRRELAESAARSRALMEAV